MSMTLRRETAVSLLITAAICGVLGAMSAVHHLRRADGSGVVEPLPKYTSNEPLRPPTQASALRVTGASTLTAASPFSGPDPADSAPVPQSEWEVLLGWQWAANGFNQADCFRLKAAPAKRESASSHASSGSRENVFQLYFIAAPPAAPIDGDDAELAHLEPFHLETEMLVEVGQEALAFAADQLSAPDFVTFTKWEQPRLSRERYAFVYVENAQSKKVTLQELLVSSGHAVVLSPEEEKKASFTELPDGQPLKPWINRLRALEHEAQENRRGAWGR